MAVMDKSFISSYTKDFYPSIGEKFEVKGGVVERNIRTTITKAYDVGGLIGFDEIFREIVYDNSYKSAEFIRTAIKMKS